MTRLGWRYAYLVLALAAVLSVLAAAGCGADGGGDGSASASPSAVALWTGPAPNTTPMADADSADVDDAANAALEEAQGRTPGMWLGVWDPEKGMHVGAYGAAVLPDTAAAADDHGRIGSITKTFTATAVLRLVDDGKLSLDDTVEDVLPALAADNPEIAAITVEQLLGMTSGIPDYANLPLVIPAVVADPSKVWTAEEIVQLVLDKETLQEPGTPGYSTTNYLILGLMLEELTGRPVEEVLTELAAEAGLSQTALTPGDDNAMPDPYSHGYITSLGAASLAWVGADVKPVVDATDWSASWGGAGGGMYSAIEDLGTWAATGFGTTLLTPETAALRFATTESPDAGRYGLGIMDFGEGWIGHIGQIIGWESVALYNTGSGAVYVAIVNETGSLSTALSAIAAVDPEVGALFQ